MFGILNIKKPAGWSSRDVVNRVYGLVRPAKAGHVGTLDPLATGVLIVAVGPATKLIQYSHRLAKRYRGTFLLGRRSASDDVETAQETIADAPVPDGSAVHSVLRDFLGEIEQIPPKYSAVKVQGQRSYKLARRGKEVEIPSRQVTIHSLRVARYEYPELVLEIECSSGTYIRSLGRDIAESLGTCAVMSALERTAIGSMAIEDAVDVDRLQQLDELLLPPLPLVETLRRIELTEFEISRLHHGQMIAVQESRIRESSAAVYPSESEVVGIAEAGHIVSILQALDEGVLKPICNLPQPS